MNNKKVIFNSQNGNFEGYVSDDEQEAKRREKEYILYTYLYPSPIENTYGTKKIVKSARENYIIQSKSLIKSACKQGLINNIFNPFNIADSSLAQKILDSLKDEKRWRNIDDNKSHKAPSAFLKHYIDFLDKFKMPQFLYLEVNQDDKIQHYPLDEMTSNNVNKGDICIFYESGIGVRHIGRLDKIENNKAYFEILLKLNKPIEKEITLPAEKGRDKITRISDQEGALDLVLDCFKQAEKEGNISSTSTNSNKIDNKIVDNNKISQIPLNQILYGPPGTGKTYSTINKALEILAAFGEIKENPQDRAEKKRVFDEFRKSGQIEFITFHQSYAYEEFVEGIKPEVDDDKNMTYEVKDGIFKQICQEAQINTKEFLQIQKAQIQDSQSSIDLSKKLWRLYTLPAGDTNNDYFDELIEKNYVWASKDYGAKELENKVEVDDCIIIPSAVAGKRKIAIRAFGILNEIIKNKTNGDKSYRKVEWLWVAKDTENEISFNSNFGIKTFQQVHMGKEVILRYMQKLVSKKDLKTKPYILIIDEINRANISKVLGELITLLEPSKRIGADEELCVKLPYSNEIFGVPSNLYIVATMNTADRSIALLDTALRRRFDFEELLPKPALLNSDCAGVDLQKLLRAINQRIEFLLDREHSIGHAFFMSVRDLDSLKFVFKQKIIPLLQEYFYEDYSKIKAVLNDNGMIEEATEKYKKALTNFSDLFDKEKKIYKIADSNDIWDSKETYIKIYQNVSDEK